VARRRGEQHAQPGLVLGCELARQGHAGLAGLAGVHMNEDAA
jgi:hypothetical protein